MYSLVPQQRDLRAPALNDVELLLRRLVGAVTMPAQVDDHGQRVLPDYEFKGVKYTELIPILVATTHACWLARSQVILSIV